MKINMHDWAQEIIKAKDRRNLPILFFPCLKNISTGVIEAVQDGEKMAQAMAEVIREYPDTIAAITGMDLTVDSEAFGAEVKFSKRQAPTIRGAVLKNAEEIDCLKVPGEHAGRQKIVIQAVEKAQELITDRPVFGGMLGPFSLAANLLEVSAALMMTVKDLDVMNRLLEKTTDFLLQRAKSFKEAGANGVFIAEPTAGLLSPEMCEIFSSKYVKKITDKLQDETFFIILHNCGNVTNSLMSMYHTGCKGFHFGNSVSMPVIAEQIPDNVLVFGNIDPSTDFFLGTPETVYYSTMNLLKSMEKFPHFVLSSGCDLAPSVPAENIGAYFQACRDYNSAITKYQNRDGG